MRCKGSYLSNFKKLGSLSWAAPRGPAGAGPKPDELRYRLVKLDEAVKAGKAPLQGK